MGRLLLRVLLGLVLILPGRPAGADELMVFAASSLTEAFTELGRQYEQAHPDTRIVFHFAGSQALAAQISQGAAVDVFAAADDQVMTRLLKQGLIETPAFFAGNSLALIVSRQAVQPIPDLNSLARPGNLLILGAPSVPVGRYTQRLLDSLGSDPAYGPAFVAGVRGNLVSEEASVKGVATKVALGEADAGVVYVSDLAPYLRERVRVIPLPEVHVPPVRYPVALVTDSSRKVSARRFIDYLLSPQGQRILAAHGFLPAR